MKRWILLTLPFLSFTLHAQNVGIGTLNPSRARLEVHGVMGNGTTSAVFGSDAAGISFQRSWPSVGFNQYRDNPAGYGKFISGGFGAVQHFDPASGTMGFDMMGGGQYETSPALTRRSLSMNYNGQVTVGNTAYPAALTVARGSHNATAYFFGSQHYSAFNLGNAEDTYIRAGKDGGTVFINDITSSKVVMSGFVGINTATPAYPLEIRQTDGKGFAIVEGTNFNNWDLNLYTNPSFGTGHLYLNNSGGTNKGWFSSVDGSYHHVSDVRLKTAIQSLPSLLNKYMQLRPVTYKMIHDSLGEEKIGFIAQEVRALFPELVTVTKDTARTYPGISNLHMLNYEGFAVLTIKAVQEQQAILKEQKALIQKFSEKLDRLKRTGKAGEHTSQKSVGKRH